MNIQNLLDHLSEVKDTLSNGLVGQRLANEGQVISNNIQQSFPFLRPNPTIDDLVNSLGMSGSISGQYKLFKYPEILQKLKDEGYDLKTPWYHGSTIRIKPGEERLPHFYTNDKNYARAMGIEYKGVDTGVLHKVLSKPNSLVNAMDDSLILSDIGKKSNANITYDDAGRIDFLNDVNNYNPVVEGYNAADIGYLPEVRNYLDSINKKGYKAIDIFEGDEVPAIVYTSKPDTYELSARKISQTPSKLLNKQIRKLYKKKAP